MVDRLHFPTEWVFDASIQSVWAILSKPGMLSRWWPGFERVTILTDTGGAGTITDNIVNVGMGLRLHFVFTVEEQQPPEQMRISVAGDSIGVTEWRLRQDGQQTRVSHLWDVRVQRPLLRLTNAIPGSHGFFKRRHNATMRQGYRNLAALLEKA